VIAWYWEHCAKDRKSASVRQSPNTVFVTFYDFFKSPQNINIHRLQRNMTTRILPLELLDKAIGSKIWILMRSQTEIVGTLRGFDDYVNLVLDDAVEFSPDPRNGEIVKTELDSEILLNGNHVAVLIPGGNGPDDSMASSSSTWDAI